MTGPLGGFLAGAATAFQDVAKQTHQRWSYNDLLKERARLDMEKEQRIEQANIRAEGRQEEANIRSEGRQEEANIRGEQRENATWTERRGILSNEELAKENRENSRWNERRGILSAEELAKEKREYENFTKKEDYKLTLKEREAKMGLVDPVKKARLDKLNLELKSLETSKNLSEVDKQKVKSLGSQLGKLAVESGPGINTDANAKSIRNINSALMFFDNVSRYGKGQATEAAKKSYMKKHAELVKKGDKEGVKELEEVRVLIGF